MQLKMLPRRPNARYKVMPYRIICCCINGRFVTDIVLETFLSEKNYVRVRKIDTQLFYKEQSRRKEENLRNGVCFSRRN
jgi:hypothetical protein